MPLPGPDWLIWLIAAVGLVLVDLTLAGAQFIVAAAAVAALAAMGVAALGAGIETQIWTFLAVTTLTVPVALHAMRRRNRTRRPLVRDAGWAEGMESVVEQSGARLLVRLQGDTYPARRADNGPLSPGMRVRVREMDSITAIVEPVGSSSPPTS